MRILIAQGGGPTAVINQSLVGAILEAKKQNYEIIGSRFGISGIITENLVELHNIEASQLEAIAETSASALGSTRDKPDETYCQKILAVLKKQKINAFLYIGGNDSSETVRIVTDFAKKEDYPLKGFHIPKTVDNDLMENDHTPGWPSAARFVAKATMGIDRDNASLPGVHLLIIMGRHSGFLTCAASLCKAYPNKTASATPSSLISHLSSLLSSPHLTYIPEHPFDLSTFTAEVKNTIKQNGRCVVAVSEGIQDKQGTSIAQQLTKSTEIDAHGNIQLSSLPLGDLLANFVKEKTGIKRVRQDAFGYTQRSFPDPSPVDQREARAVGTYAIELCGNSPSPAKERGLGGEVSSGSIVIRRVSDSPYTSHIDVVNLEKVANKTRHLPENFYNPSTKQVTQAFFDYALPLVGKLPTSRTL